ncbi:DUF2510 domain-containing protein [Agromyces soli]
MSDGQQIAAGWYPDPAGSGGQRWWDGIGWTQHVTPPEPAPVAAPAAPAVPAAPAAAQPFAAVAAAPQPLAQYTAQAPAYRPEMLGRDTQVPVSTPTGTVWVWLLIFLPLLSSVPLFFWDVRGYMERSLSDPYGSMSMMLDPWYLALMGLGWLAYGVGVLFAYLDYAALGRLGYGRRFHWAWTFLSSLVYVIGRCVIVRRQADGRGAAPMWTMIGVTIASFVIGIAYAVWMMTVMFEVIASTVQSY